MEDFFTTIFSFFLDICIIRDYIVEAIGVLFTLSFFYIIGRGLLEHMYPNLFKD